LDLDLYLVIRDGHATLMGFGEPPQYAETERRRYHKEDCKDAYLQVNVQFIQAIQTFSMLDILSTVYLQLLQFFESLFFSNSIISSTMGPALLDKLNYFGWLGSGSATPPQEEKKNATRALPSNWYTSKQMYELERRAIFSRKWQLITHKARLTQPGDWLKFDVAGFQIVICKDRESNINAFHNVCRHRAFPVVEGQSGNNKIFSCKYHGWSYGMNGKLAKAPGYQELDGFQKEKNGLLPVHVHVDVNDFVWINLDGGAQPEIAWEDDFDGIDKQKRYEEFNFSDYQFDHTWQMEGDYNWKILADNYNECYHCATTHPDIVAVANLEAYSVDTTGDKIIHNPGTTQEQADNGMTVASTYYFPNVSTNIT